jgi:hypothetical protein
VLVSTFQQVEDEGFENLSKVCTIVSSVVGRMVI